MCRIGANAYVIYRINDTDVNACVIVRPVRFFMMIRSLSNVPNVVGKKGGQAEPTKNAQMAQT